MRRGLVALAVASAGVAVGVLSLRVAARAPAASFAGTSSGGRVALVAAGWTLIACGLVRWVGRSASTFGMLLAAGGFAWFLLDWDNPGVKSSAAFTIGLVFYASCAPLLAHAVLGFPDGRLSGLVERAGVASAYVTGVLVLGLLPAFFFDPVRTGCNECPRNLLVIANRPAIIDWLDRVGGWMFAVCAGALAALAAVKLVGASVAARRAVWPVLAAGVVYLGLVAATFAASHDRPLPWNDSLERQLWRAQSIALLAIVAGVAWHWLRTHRRRSALARLVLELGKSPPPGRLREALAEIIGDSELELAYPLEASEQLVDSQGHAVEIPAGKQQTTLLGGGRRLAVLSHRPGLLDDEQLVREVTDVARLALENERLQAEVRARLVELRRSRARIVEAGDEERRRLERDLHDGAQQRLAGLALSLRLIRSRMDDADPATVAQLEAAEVDVQAAVEGLRELAHGIFPAVLADGGLAAALVSLAEDAHVPIRLENVERGRVAPGVEAAAYAVVAQTVSAAAGGLVVRTDRSSATLVLDVEARDVGTSFDRGELEDRVGAADGRLTVEGRNGTVTIHVEFPCAS